MPGSIEGAPGILEAEHWEFCFDARPANHTWSWRHVGEEGWILGKSAAYTDLRRTISDAASRGFSPAAGNWVFRGMPMQVQSVARRRTVSA